MSDEIKPVYQRSSCGAEWNEITWEFYSRYAGADGYCYRILYPAAAYEALQKENAELIKDRQHYANRADLSEKSVDVLQADNAAQAKRIAELEAQIGWVNSLDGEDAMYELILQRAKQSYMRHKYSVRGQIITKLDDLQTHIIHSAFEYLSASKNGE